MPTGDSIPRPHRVGPGRRSPRSGTTGQRGEHVVVLADPGARSRFDSRYHGEEIMVAVGDRLSR